MLCLQMIKSARLNISEMGKSFANECAERSVCWCMFVCSWSMLYLMLELGWIKQTQQRFYHTTSPGIWQVCYSLEWCRQQAGCTGQDNPMLRHLELQWRKECVVQASTVEPSASLLLRNTTAHNKACPGAKVVAVFLLLFAELSSRPDISVIHVRWSCTV